MFDLPRPGASTAGVHLFLSLPSSVLRLPTSLPRAIHVHDERSAFHWGDLCPLSFREAMTIFIQRLSAGQKSVSVCVCLSVANSSLSFVI